MPSGAGAKKLLILAGVGLTVLLCHGFVHGELGSATGGTEQFLDKPEIHLSPQPIFPASTRNESLGLSEVAESASEDGSEEEAHFTPMSASKIAVTNTLFILLPILLLNI